MQSLATSRIADMDFPTKLKLMCAARDIKQRQLADLLSGRGPEISKSKVNTWFSGVHEPSLSEAYRLAAVLGVSVEYLARPELENPRDGSLTEDERIIVDTCRAMKLTKSEALSRLARERADDVEHPAAAPHGPAELLHRRYTTELDDAREKVERAAEVAARKGKGSRSAVKRPTDKR